MRTLRNGWFAGLAVALLPMFAQAETANARDDGSGYEVSYLERQPGAEWRNPGRLLSVPGRSVEALEALFARLDYRLDRVRERGVVPRLLVRRMPHGISELHPTQRRKALFIRIALPLILTANETILRDRKRIERLWAARDRDVLPAGEKPWLLKIFAAYKAAPFDFRELLSRVDIVPPSLAVAQAAEETGWGTSRFVRRGNALFGERTYKGAEGMVPRRIAPGDKFRIRRFGQLLAAVDAYVSNLNTHPAYTAFRARRAAMRAAAEGTLDASDLAGGLEAYSVRRGAYVRTVRAIIRTNGLAELDSLKLDPGLPRFAEGPAAAAGLAN